MANTIQNKVANKSIGNQPTQSINTLLNTMLDGEKMRTRFNELLGDRSPQFISSLVSLINADISLQRAFYESPMSVIQAALKAATFDLPIDNNLGYAYIVAFNNNKKQADGTWKKVMEAAFMLGWKGMHQLALRTSIYKRINVVDIREGELKYYDRLTEEIEVKFIEDEDKRDLLPVIGYVGYYRLINGAEKTIYMTVKQIGKHEEKFRKGDQMGKGWKDDWDAMARKTVYRKLIGKWGVMSIDYRNRKEAVALANQIQEEYQLESANIEAEYTESTEENNTEVDTETGELVEN